MPAKPQIAAGLDLGSSSTRCLILLLEDGRLRYAGHSQVPSAGWSKGKLADQRSRHRLRARRRARSRSTRARFRGCPGSGHGRRKRRRFAIAAGSTNSDGPVPVTLDDMAYAVERSEQVRLEEDRMILHLFPQDFTLGWPFGQALPARFHLFAPGSQRSHRHLLGAGAPRRYVCRSTSFLRSGRVHV